VVARHPLNLITRSQSVSKLLTDVGVDADCSWSHGRESTLVERVDLDASVDVEPVRLGVVLKKTGHDTVRGEINP